MPEYQTVQSRCTVKKYWMFSNNFFKNIPHHNITAVYKTLCALHVLSSPYHQTLNNEWLEQPQSHRLWQNRTGACGQGWSNHNYAGTTRVIIRLPSKVLTGNGLLTLEHIRTKGLQWAVGGSCYWTTATTVIEERINCFLQHALSLFKNDFWSTQFNQSLQTVITVNNRRRYKSSNQRLHSVHHQSWEPWAAILLE